MPEEVSACTEPVGCKSNEGCADGEYCAKKDGLCDSVGICSPLVSECDLVYAPICACNGQTYGNACEAATAGVNVASEGTCENICGTIAGLPCPEGWQCDFQAGLCKVSDLAGSCVVTPEACPDVWKPVCGCDGKTYGNDCERLVAGVQKAKDGSCDCAPVQCQKGSTPSDTDDDGCDDACVPCPQIQCMGTAQPVDLNGDGCNDACEAAQCFNNADCGDGNYCKKGCFTDGPGKCAAKPEGCFALWKPVCGCSGTTYGNSCEAAAAGENVAHEGECVEVCGAIAGIPCPEGSFCQFEAGTCLFSDNQGTCVEVPEACPENWDPVCDCQGETHSNECFMIMAGQQKDHDGQCSCKFAIKCANGYTAIDTDGDGCDDDCIPVKCTENADCGKGLYCGKEAGDCDGNGTCQVVPEFCTKEFAPVCSCSGVTYGNGCMAAHAGENVASKGACSSSCKADAECAKGQFCEKPEATCYAKDAPGQCVDKPDACLSVWDPVCGCGGLTYPNDCVRQAAGVSKDYDGECTCKSNEDCAAGSYCKKESCGDAGKCVTQPDKCILVYSPVCSCTGKTYSNSCFAAAAGDNVASKGECEPNVDKCESSSDCEIGQYCAKKDGNCDGVGQCADKPKGCDLVYSPVCGCSGETWGNACAAALAGDNVASPGKCEELCGGKQGIPCAKGQLCDLPGGMCGSADMLGQCVEEPEFCDKSWKPVCACSGETYPNDCARLKDGAQLDHVGSCECDQIKCLQGTVATDTTGDGCFDSCLPCPQIKCANGFQAQDTNGDGCFDSCVPVACKDNSGCGDGAYCQKKSCNGEGTCAPKPEACALYVEPVCSCSGETFNNACEAAANGQNVAYKGFCEVQCGGFAGLSCPKGSWCEMEAGTCGGADFFGTCVEVPLGCPDVWDPVCACDGKTYSNDCDRQVAGVQKDHDGECGCNIIIDCLPGFLPADEDGDGCDDYCVPAKCETDKDCGGLDFVYCQKGAGDCGGTGTCALTPEICTKEYAPVCSCSGKTYGNACMAQAAGENIASKGVCTSSCGGLGEFACAAGQICEYTEGTCGAGGAAGKCVDAPNACLIAVYEPTCGCDNVTYANDCFRQLAGVSKAYDGECQCTTNDDCGKAGYCNKPGCFTKDGKCQPKPTACPENYTPVCSCSGKTYPNKCTAAAAGENVASEGQCDGEVQECKTDTDCVSLDGTLSGFCQKKTGACDALGLCADKPTVCPDVVAPVCSCSGKTFGNECEALAAGQNVAYEGECKTVDVTCKDDVQCGKNQYCQKDQCDGEGVCASKPQFCPEYYSPVCGCDGVTYDNPCFAASAGVNVAYKGACKQVACQSDKQCAPGSYCQKESCKAENGVCSEKPQICTDEYDPWCACDGQAYGNTCEAAAAGVNLAYKGQCGVVSLCKGNEECSEGSYCSKKPSVCDSGYGVCAELPTACPQIYAPVCACSGKTYGNACEAGAAGQNVLHEGKCEPVVNECTDNTGCAQGEYCEKTLGDCDGAGTCVATPDICPLYVDPVCSCGGETFSNPCFAAAAGVNIKHKGACEVVGTGCTSNAECAITLDGQKQFCQKKTGNCEGEGECADVPVGCPDVWAPVCSCEGKTFGNSCEAATAGQNIKHEGECQVVSLCDSNKQCAADAYCLTTTCGGKGQCTSKPVGCSKEYAPVCSCSGVTYDNACFAAMAGAVVASKGACETACKTNEECTIKGQYCAKGAGDCDGAGKCVPMPDACPAIYDPQCGCDGKTYGNACAAAAAGVNVMSKGECPVVAVECKDNTECSDGLYCQKKAGNCDGPGHCAKKPEACTLQYDPACGCDGKTYGNACAAGLAGMNVAYPGECKVAPVLCKSNEECADGELCKKTLGGCDQAGVCSDVPSGCFNVYDPICGCDNQTYSNECEAWAAGQSAQYKGECKCDFAIKCQVGFKPIDTDGDGCDDFCQPICNIAIDCAPGFEAIDTDNDGCADSCKAVCGTPCDCYDNAFLDFEKPCAMLCPTCDNFWTCEAGFCQGNCGPVPPEISKCIETCDPIKCIDGFEPFDSDDDGCDDKCVPSGANCESACDCYDQKIEFPEQCQLKCLGCGNFWGCQAGQCVPNCGFIPDEIEKCLCVDIVCGVGQKGVDTDNDGCLDECQNVSFACGGFAGLVCPKGMVCEYPTGMCNVSDLGGTCVAAPDGCTEEYAPVCACSGKTYSNACYALLEGAQINHKGECKPTCVDEQCAADEQGIDQNNDGCVDVCIPANCQLDDECLLDGYYCVKPMGSCDGFGKCIPKGGACNGLDSGPTCGCDGETYGSACEASQMGVSLAANGECKVTPQTCGGIASLKCDDGQTCQYPPGQCNTADLAGQCVDKPAVCGKFLDPVCSCSGETYTNSCHALVAGALIDYKGECKVICTDMKCEPGEQGVDTDNNGCTDICIPANCQKNAECQLDTYYCYKPTGSCGGFGKCIPKGSVDCNVVDGPATVCACDGNTYDSACEASKAGTSINKVGACVSDTKTCGGFLGIQCAKGEYCDLPAGMCNSADMTGTCVTADNICSTVFDPVCGCNGKTYSNDCLRIQAGEQKNYDGQCKLSPGDPQ